MAHNTRQPSSGAQRSDLERIEAFEEARARAESTEVADVAWGYVLLQRDFARSHDHNRVVVTAATAPPTVDEVIAATDQVLGQAGVQHRYVTVVNDSVGASMVPAFTAADFTHEPIATMIYRGASMPPPEHDVTDPTPDQLRTAIIRDWRHELPDADEQVYEQLADRTSLYSRGAEVASLAVRAADEVAARATLFLDRENGLAQFESLNTGAHHRGHGYARSIVREGLRRAASAGCQLCFLSADLDDWPHEWYQRLGFIEVTRTHHFTRSAH